MFEAHEQAQARALADGDEMSMQTTFRFRRALAADAAECVRIRGLTRENSVSVGRLRSAGITVESWASDIESGSLPGFICESPAAMDGHEVARQIRRLPHGREVTLVALTGWGQEEDRQRSRAAGFDFHLVKPASLEALRELLASSDRRVETVSE